MRHSVMHRPDDADVPVTKTQAATAARAREAILRHLRRTDAKYIEVNRQILEDAYSILINVVAGRPSNAQITGPAPQARPSTETTDAGSGASTCSTALPSEEI
jgi:hypothetical protein